MAGESITVYILHPLFYYIRDVPLVTDIFGILLALLLSADVGQSTTLSLRGILNDIIGQLKNMFIL